MQRRTLQTQGQQALVALRDSLRQDARTAQTFPLVKTRTVDPGNGELVHGTSTMHRYPGGFVVTWANTTEQVRIAEVMRELTEELPTASAQLAQAGEALVSTAGQGGGPGGARVPRAGAGAPGSPGGRPPGAPPPAGGAAAPRAPRRAP